MTGIRSLKTEALVIGSMRLREADRIITFYTRELGRLSAVAKGVRRTSSRMGGRLEPFSLVHVMLHPGRGSLYTVTSVETIRTFQAVRDELFRMEAGGRLLEAVRSLFPEEEENPAAFNLLVRGIARLGQAEQRGEAHLAVLATRLKLLLALGYLPELDACTECGSGELLCAFRPSLGGVLCADCFSGEAHDCFAISPEGMAGLHELLERPLGQVDGRELTPEVIGEVERALTQTLLYHGH
ncbi:MAG: DNA repair protein RecO [Thermoleophilia bacterium]|nr:DNA repair protein RecO [Thermoleophilia bacterium]